MDSGISWPLHYRFWDFPLRAELLLSKAVPLLTQEEPGRSARKILDFGPTFPWRSEPRLSRDPRYPEEFLVVLANELREGEGFSWYLPLSPLPWRGDLHFYDLLVEEGNPLPFIRFLQEQVDDLRELGFRKIALCLDPLNLGKNKATHLFFQSLKKSHLPYWIMPRRRHTESFANLLVPSLIHDIDALSNRTKKIMALGCGILDTLGFLFLGSVGGYDEKESLERTMGEFHRQKELLQGDWEKWVLGADAYLLPESSRQICEGKLYGLNALEELLETRNKEYLRYRRLFPHFSPE
ncbi:MAG: hypothetical protein GW949_02055 [Spirochaetales bacterium]|nr:hypothetical protein [Spirochaetales bacterium]